MTQASRAHERSKFSLHRAALLFSNHLEMHPRAQSAWAASIDEGCEPLPPALLEARRLHLRTTLMPPIVQPDMNRR